MSEAALQRQRAERANRVAIGLSVLLALDCLLMTAGWGLTLAIALQQALIASEAPAAEIIVRHAGDAPEAVANDRWALQLLGLLTAGALAITTLYLWSFFGMIRQVTWRFVIVIQSVVLLLAVLRIVWLLLAVSMIANNDLLTQIDPGLVTVHVSDWVLPLLWPVLSVAIAVTIIALLTRREVKQLYGLDQARRLRHTRASA